MEETKFDVEMIVPEPADFDPEEWERKRKEEKEKEIEPFRLLREQINEHDELMADTLYELTMMQLGMEV